MWIFGYGSLIWRPDFPWLERRTARIDGWTRRFWQGSHDHRGVPERPGRVVTLVETPGGHCDGMAYRVDERTSRQIFRALDHREQNGYRRQAVLLRFLPSAATAEGTVYIASGDNHAWLGPAPLAAMAQQIAASHGPSGRNADYLLELAAALRAMAADDHHVFELEAAVRSALP